MNPTGKYQSFPTIDLQDRRWPSKKHTSPKVVQCRSPRWESGIASSYGGVSKNRDVRNVGRVRF